MLVPDWPVVADWLQRLRERHWSAAPLLPGAAPEPAGATAAAVQVTELPAGEGTKEREKKQHKKVAGERCN